MVEISKNERFYLESKGLKFGQGLNKTRSKRPHYYMTESFKNKELLRKYREKLGYSL